MDDGGYRITTHDAALFTDDEVVLEADVFNEFETEVWPEDPVTSGAAFLAAHRAVPSRVRRTAVRAWSSDGVLVGSAGVSVDPEHDDDPDLLTCSLIVARAHRRRGVGTSLLARLAEVARAEGRTRLVGRTQGPIPAGARFATAIGATAKAASHWNHLAIADVDRALMESWVANGPLRAPGYELLLWDGPIPQQHLADFVELMLVMNDAPRDDLARNDFTLTPARWREAETHNFALGRGRWTAVARRAADGELAGLHDLVWDPQVPAAMFVGSTGVRRAHRGAALGKWLKAALTLRVLDERPGVTEIRTENADSNEAMLGINAQMGYRPVIGATTWELVI